MGVDEIKEDNRQYLFCSDCHLAIIKPCLKSSELICIKLKANKMFKGSYTFPGGQ